MRDFDITAMLSQPAETDPEEEFKEKLYEKVDANISDEEFNVQKLSDVMAMDFKKESGITPSEYRSERIPHTDSDQSPEHDAAVPTK